MDPLSQGWQAAFYIAALVCLLLDMVPELLPRMRLLPLGIALVVFVLAYNALALALA